MLKYLGLDRGADGTRAWDGVPNRQRLAASLLALVLGAITFFTSRWLLADAHGSGFVHQVPWLLGVLVCLVATLLAQQSLAGRREK